VDVDGVEFEIAPGEAEVRVTPKAGWAVATEGGYTVAVSTELTRELVQEGLAAKSSDACRTCGKRPISASRTDHDVLWADGKLAEAIAAWSDYIKQRHVGRADDG